jgi:ABC-2 type transport system permease protein
MLLLVIFGELPAFHQPAASLGGLTAFDVYVPILAVFGLAMLPLLGLPIPLVTYRELGVLRRLSTTPVPPSWLLAAQGAVQLCVALTGLAVIVVAGVAAFGAPAPKSPGGLVLSVVLSIAGLFPIGLVIAAVARTANSASVIGRLAFFP